MIEELVLALALAAVVTLADFICDLISAWGRQKAPQAARAEMSETDREMARRSQERLRECFGEDVVGRLRDASNRERIDLVADFAEKLARDYGLDIQVDVMVEHVRSCGTYDWQKRKAVFNIALLTVEGTHEQFDYCVREVLDTIVHELRHAVQHRAIREEGFWQVDQERRNQWANNLARGNYIQPSVDLRAYAAQPVEADATTFAGMVMEGVK